MTMTRCARCFPGNWLRVHRGHRAHVKFGSRLVPQLGDETGFNDSVPEGDTIYRAAATLHRALAGQPVVRFESVFPALTRVARRSPADGDDGRQGRVDRQAHPDAFLLAVWSSGPTCGCVEAGTIYRPGERWRQRKGNMRVLGGDIHFRASRFSIPRRRIHQGPRPRKPQGSGHARSRRSRHQLRSGRSRSAPSAPNQFASW